MRKDGRIDDEGKLSVLCGSNCSNNELRETLPQSRGGAGPMIVMGGVEGGYPEHGHWRLSPGASIGANGMETMPNTNRLTHFLPNHYSSYKPHWLQRCSVYCLLREYSEITINFCPLAYSIHSHLISICYGCPNAICLFEKGGAQPGHQPTGAYYENPRQETEDNDSLIIQHA